MKLKIYDKKGKYYVEDGEYLHWFDDINTLNRWIKEFVGGLNV